MYEAYLQDLEWWFLPQSTFKCPLNLRLSILSMKFKGKAQLLKAKARRTFVKLKIESVEEVKTIVMMEDVPAELVMNWD